MTSTLTVPETQTQNDQWLMSSMIVPETQNDQWPTTSTIVPEMQPIPDIILSSDDGDNDENGGNENEEKIQSESER